MITLLLGNVAGLIAYTIANDYEIDAVVAYDNRQVYREFGAKVYDSIKQMEVWHTPYVEDESRILMSVHGREIVPDETLKRYGYCVNVHPFYNKYKGVSPVKRAIADHYTEADVTAHKMTSKVDEGEILFQEKILVAKLGMLGLTGVTEQGVYQELYPLYAKVIRQTIEFYITNDKHYSNLTD